MLDAESGPRVRAAFPSTVAAEVEAVIGFLPPSSYRVSPRDIGEISLSGEPVRIPERIYLPDPEPGAAATLTVPQRTVLSCVYTRHHDGHVREAALRSIVQASDEWVPPFVVQLLGEYVIEIVHIVLANMQYLGTPAFRRFVVENPAFLAKTRARAISYWDCHYRRAALRKEDYAGIRALDALVRLGQA